MISFLKGKIIEKRPTEVVLEANSVGFSIFISVKTYEMLPEVGSNAFIYTILIHREDSMALYGFINEEERELFRNLINISGIGPKSAIGILSAIDSIELKNMIINGNSISLSKVPGIGKKTSERIVLELKDKISKTFIQTEITTKNGISPRNEALNALLVLGYNKNTAEKVISEIIVSAKDKNLTLEEMIKLALQKLMK
ncbi:MAG: Holliday junction branch migration protein RuvA [Chloroherpetonaceae bacterium]|jgi:Holliday junction DNA helicase RuvA|nr:Holliday junction branch migration protein RuvA [bacterium]HAW07623.1 Holliday junction branch migration protein RuvA [Bacteroidota bacterium]